MFSGRRNGGGGYYVGIEVAGFGRVHGGADGADFTEAHLRDGIEKAWVDLEALAIDHLCAGGNLDARAHGGDFAVFDDKRAIVDRGPREREDFRVSDGISRSGLR